MPAEATVAFLAVGFGVGDQLGEVLRREVATRQEHHRRLGEHADELEGGKRIEGELLVERRDGRHADVVQQQGVAVGLGLGRLQRAHRAAGAADILYDHSLVQLILQPFGEACAPGSRWRRPAGMARSK